MRIKSADPIDRHVGTRIRMQRMISGLSQTALGKAVGVTFQQVQKYEKGVNRVGASRLQQIANVLKVRPDFFFAETSAKAVGNAGSKEIANIEGFIWLARRLRSFKGVHQRARYQDATYRSFG